MKSETLAQFVSRRIRELGISNAEVARRTRLSPGYIGNIANETAPTRSGQYRLSQETVTKLASALDCTESEILNAMGYEVQHTEVAAVFRQVDKLPETERATVMGMVEAYLRARIDD